MTTGEAKARLRAAAGELKPANLLKRVFSMSPLVLVGIGLAVTVVPKRLIFGLAKKAFWLLKHV